MNTTTQIEDNDRRDRLTKALDAGIIHCKTINGRIEITPDILRQLDTISANYTAHTEHRG